MSTKIEWTNETWNPVTGCDKVSQGCKNCYAGRLAEGIFRNVQEYKNGFYGNVQLHPDRLEEPLHWRKPRMIFVNSMSDLFHPDLPFDFIARVFGIIAACPHHTFQILTKRPERALKFYNWLEEQGKELETWVGEAPPSGSPIPSVCVLEAEEYIPKAIENNAMKAVPFPFPNVWVGVSVEDQDAADERIPLLLRIPASIRFVSAEPLLGDIDFERIEIDTNHSAFPRSSAGGTVYWDCLTGKCYSIGGMWNIGKIDWIIAGGESGPNARPTNPTWVYGIRDQCVEAGIPFFFKQWGEWFPRDQWESKPDLVLYDDDLAYHNSNDTHVFRDCLDHFAMQKIGKKLAGREINGEEWNQMPEVNG